MLSLLRVFSFIVKPCFCLYAKQFFITEMSCNLCSEEYDELTRFEECLHSICTSCSLVSFRDGCICCVRTLNRNSIPRQFNGNKVKQMNDYNVFTLKMP